MIAESRIDEHLQLIDDEISEQQALDAINSIAPAGLDAEKIINSQRKDGTVYAVCFSWQMNETYERFFTSQWYKSLTKLLPDVISSIEDLAMNIFSTSLFEYLSGDMIGDKSVTMTIKDVFLNEMNNGRSEEIKPVVTFRERKKKWVLNKTSARELAAKMGAETNEWIGRQVILHAPQISAFGRTMRAIRVKEVLPAMPNGNGRYTFEDANKELIN